MKGKQEFAGYKLCSNSKQHLFSSPVDIPNF